MKKVIFFILMFFLVGFKWARADSWDILDSTLSTCFSYINQRPLQVSMILYTLFWAKNRMDYYADRNPIKCTIWLGDLSYTFFRKADMSFWELFFFMPSNTDILAGRLKRFKKEN
jgi:hypothetical protein